MIALRDYQQQHPDEPIYLAYFGSIDPSLYGIHATPLAANEQLKGTLIVSPTLLSGQNLDDSDAYRWLGPYAPARVLDHSLWVYDLR